MICHATTNILNKITVQQSSFYVKKLEDSQLDFRQTITIPFENKPPLSKFFTMLKRSTIGFGNAYDDLDSMNCGEID